MKFTDGFWVTKPGVTMHSTAQVRDCTVIANAAVLYCPTRRITHRGMTLDGPMLTLTFTSPAPDILALSVVHFKGVARKEPLFELNRNAATLTAIDSGDSVTITSGKLSAIVSKDKFRLDYYYNGERLTGLGDRHLSLAETSDGSFIRVKLDVDVGEKIYGLGERFTPFVKNGQSVDIWNEDGGTASELAYKSIPFYVTNKGYGVFVNSPGCVSYELCSEAVASAQFSLRGESMEFMVVGGPRIKDAVSRFVKLTGRAALPPAWSFGLWLTTSFTTDYTEETINSFVDGMLERGIPLRVFHFDCFWMKEWEWCNFLWDERMFPDPEGMIKRLHERGLKVCVWINPYIGQKSPLFDEGMRGGFLLKRPNGDVWQWDRWQPGLAIVDFTNPGAVEWYQSKLKTLTDMGVDSFKTDFGERIPVDCVYYDGSDPALMHNYYTSLYNKTVFELLERERGVGEACVFARSATVGGQQYPVHWGGDSTSNYPSMAESLRAGLSLSMSGFAFWSHDISGFEDMASPDVYKRWTAFGLLSTHSRLHGSGSYRVPWLFGDEAVDVARFFTKLKYTLMPYLFAKSVEAHETGVPVMRAMAMEFPDDPACGELDRQYMLGDVLLVAPVFRADGAVTYYLPAGTWTHLLTGETKDGGSWRTEVYDFMSLPLFVREGSLLAIGHVDDRADYDYRCASTIHAYNLTDGEPAAVDLFDSRGENRVRAQVSVNNGVPEAVVSGGDMGFDIVIHRAGSEDIRVKAK
ncbi:MAG: alpha-xylosidase [Oscillospiraceae bacterium]|jgi:alpha-D-xyloside xylohydrolase|nr:alpha-xylosidase [Oscillospiraceae bacterium]